MQFVKYATIFTDAAIEMKQKTDKTEIKQIMISFDLKKVWGLV